jgi:hypothetical protein
MDAKPDDGRREKAAICSPLLFGAQDMIDNAQPEDMGAQGVGLSWRVMR